MSQVHFIIAACENMIDGRGMRPGDVLTAMNGLTVEVRAFKLGTTRFCSTLACVLPVLW